LESILKYFVLKTSSGFKKGWLPKREIRHEQSECLSGSMKNKSFGDISIQVK
jgi:hypothetical protein